MRVLQSLQVSRRLSNRQGATTVEMAVTFPILILLVMLIFEMSRIMMVQQCLGYAAQQGCRSASLATTLTEAQVTSEVRACMLPVIANQADAVSVQVTPTTMAGINSGTQVLVDAQVSLADVSWVPGNFLYFLGNPTLSAQAVQDRE